MCLVLHYILAKHEGNSREQEKNFGIRKNLLQEVLRTELQERIRNEELYNRIHLKETLLQTVLRRNYDFSDTFAGWITTEKPKTSCLE